MTFKKRLLAVLAAGALTAATAVPAMALENEFHGLFRVRAFLDNYSDGGAGTLTPSKEPGTRNFIEQRARLMYIAKANDDLKLVTHFEIDSRWGDNSYNSNGSTRNNGGGIGADQTNLETKNVYLDFNIPSTPVNVKAGIQGFVDAYKGIVFNNDAAGVVASSKLGDAAVQLAYFRFDDATSGNSFSNFGLAAAPASATVTDNTTPGNRTRDFVNLSGKYNVTKDIKVGADYFLLYSDVFRSSVDRTDIHMLGVNAEAKAGDATVDGFFLYQLGKVGNSTAGVGGAQTVNAFAANLGGKMKCGPGVARVNALYISGDKSTNASGDRNDFQTIMERGATTAGHAFYPGEMMIMLRNKYNTNSDKAVVFDLNNQGQGLIGGFLGYDVTVNKLFVNTNLGFGAVAKNSTSRNNDYLGTEFNTEIGYKLYDNLTASFQGAYMVLGGYFAGTGSGSNPENPYTTRVQLQYTF